MTRIEEIQKRLSKITYGDYYTNKSGTIYANGTCVAIKPKGNKPQTKYDTPERQLDTMEFLAHAKEDIEYLLDLVKELTKSPVEVTEQKYKQAQQALSELTVYNWK